MNKALINWWQGSGSSYTSEYQAVLDRATALGYTQPSDAQKVKQNALIVALKAAGAWTELDLFYLPRNDSSSAFWRLNWITPASFELADVGAGVTKSSNGIAGNGSNTAASTLWIPATNAVKYALNDASIIFQINNNVAEGKYAIGIAAGGNEITLAPKWSDNNFYGVVNGLSSSFNTYANATSVGFYQMVRTASNSISLYKDGSLVDTEVKNSSALPSGVLNYLYLCARNGASFSTYQIGFTAIGSNLASKASDIYNAWVSYVS